MDVSAKWNAGQFTVLDLNDDCLREVFEFLDENALSAVADVCVRFRQNAIDMARLKVKHLELKQPTSVYDYSKLRNFGAFITSIHMIGSAHKKPMTKRQKRIAQHVSRYCVGKSIKLKLNNVALSSEVALAMRPLLTNTQLLEFFDCHQEDVILKHLATWSPELRELKYWTCNSEEEKRTSFNGLHHHFPKMESISLRGTKGVENRDFVEFLKKNPQLKQVNVSHCNKLTANIYRSMAEFTPTIEQIDFKSGSGTNRNNVEPFGRLQNLKSLTLVVDGNHAELAIRKIAASNIPLESLDVSRFDAFYNTKVLFDEISKLKKLQTLRLRRVSDLDASHFIRMFEQLEELTDVHLCVIDLTMEARDLLRMVRSATKLQRFECYNLDVEGRITIDAHTFQSLLQIVEERPNRTPLTLQLGGKAFAADVPAELMKSARDTLTLEIR